MLINKLFDVNYICLYLRGEGTHGAPSQYTPLTVTLLTFLIMETVA